jgi:hydroxyacylglutathione hydrolase
MFFRQVKRNGDNFSYVIADEVSREVVVVDPSFNADELASMLKSEGFSLRYVVCTHGHSDHTAGNYQLQSALGGQVVVHSLSRIRADLKVEDGDVLNLGSVQLRVIYTPGHTPDGICLLVDGKKLLTGDTLFVGECGRVDLPGGSSFKLYDSLFNKIMKLSNEIEVYPGHDYGAKPFSTISEERKSNYVLQPRTLDEFVEFMGTP